MPLKTKRGYNVGVMSNEQLGVNLREMYFASVVRGSISEIMGGKMMSRLNILYIHKHAHTDIYIFQLKSNDMNSETILFEPQTLFNE